MAKIEEIALTSPWDTVRFINITASVGSGCGAINSRSDVLVVQALFKYLQPIDRGGKPPVGIPDSECPEPTGTFDKATARLIREFQKKHRQQLTQDGIIHPAKNGKYQWGCNKLWTIFLLNSYALDASLMKGADSYIQDLVIHYPQVENTLHRLIDI